MPQGYTLSVGAIVRYRMADLEVGHDALVARRVMLWSTNGVEVVRGAAP